MNFYIYADLFVIYIVYDDEIAESRRDVLKKMENLVWTIDVRPKRFFQNQKIKIELQNASYIEVIVR